MNINKAFLRILARVQVLNVITWMVVMFIMSNLTPEPDSRMVIILTAGLFFELLLLYATFKSLRKDLETTME